MPRAPLNLVETVHAKNAETFLDLLTPHRGGPLWDRFDHQAWIFRGQSNADWKLVPKAHRERDEFFYAGLAGGNLRPRPTTSPRTPRDLIDCEEEAAMGFASRAADLGYEIPWDSAELRDRDFTVTSHDGSNFPPSKQRGIYALAQHYGIPTRLLDWSFRPLIAAYFAAIGPARRIRDATEAGDRLLFDPQNQHLQSLARMPEGEIAVWAVNMHFLRQLLHDRDPGVVVVTVPKTSNPNLSRQEGLFTLVRFRTAPTPLVNPPALNDLLAEPALAQLVVESAGCPPLPMLYKLTLDVAETRPLLYYLHLLGVDAAAIYSGHASIVDGIGEDRFRMVCTRDQRVQWNACDPPGP